MNKWPLRWLRSGLGAWLLAACLLIFTSLSVFANTVYISDQANVLDASQVRSEGSNLPYPLSVYTVSNFNGSGSAFDNQARTHLTGQMIVIAINTGQKHVSIVWRNVPLTNSQYQDAFNAFKSGYSSGGYTAATVAAIRSLRSSLGAQPGNSSNNGSYTPVRSSGGGFSLGFLPICCIGLLILLGLGAFMIFRRRGLRPRGMGGAPFNQPVPPYGGPGYPPNQGYYPPNQGGGGMNPWAAGGLGAAGGGFLGYELGKEAGEREARERDDQGNWGGDSGGNYGGGGGDFGGGDSGGGGGDFGGGGGDFGGGGSGDGGGGGNF